MFTKQIYMERRDRVKQTMKSGVLLFLGHTDTPMNYPKNTYFFRQNSSFLYFFGLDEPGLAALIDVDENREILFGDDITVEDIIWTGVLPTMKDKAKEIGINEHKPRRELADYLSQKLQQGKRIHFLPPYRAENKMELESLLGINATASGLHASVDLVQAVIELRSLKGTEEIAEIESALAVSAEMYQTVLNQVAPGKREYELAGLIEGVALRHGRRLAFPPIVTVRGETLHNHPTGRQLQKGDLLLIDSGATSPRHYASDITRTYPVGGEFSTQQRDIYQIVLEANLTAIEAIKPGIPYRDIHLQASRIIVEGLKSLGLMKGNPDDAVQNGAHALFFPHGLGHMMGLDVHDMEDLGENRVGYPEDMERSNQFGLAYLRLAKKLQPGFVMTVEPGIYFIPALIDQWKAEKNHATFIEYAKLENYRGFGGCRIEDNVLVTKDSRRILGIPIPKKTGEIEKAGS